MELEKATQNPESRFYTINLVFSVEKETEEMKKAFRKAKEKIKQAKQANKSGCFIATAAFGTPLSAEIDILRNFRDTKMEPNPLARQFITLYYKFSPPIANVIERNESMKKVVRRNIRAMIKTIQ